MTKNDQDTNTLFDVRTVKRSIAQQRLSEERYAQYIESVEDCAANADHTVTRMISTAGRPSDLG